MKFSQISFHSECNISSRYRKDNKFISETHHKKQHKTLFLRHTFYNLSHKSYFFFLFYTKNNKILLPLQPNQ